MSNMNKFNSNRATATIASIHPLILILSPLWIVGVYAYIQQQIKQWKTQINTYQSIFHHTITSILSYLIHQLTTAPIHAVEVYPLNVTPLPFNWKSKWSSFISLSRTTYLCVYTSVVYHVHWIYFAICIGTTLIYGWNGIYILLLFHIPYLYTFRNTPHYTGIRKAKWWKQHNWIVNHIKEYVNGKVIIFEDDQNKHINSTSSTSTAASTSVPTSISTSSSATEHYMFGFHPHAIYPCTCFWLTQSSELQRYTSDITVCGATAMFLIPGMRDLLCWSGARDISAKSMHQLLSAKHSILLIPGGQYEMQFSSSTTKTIRLFTRGTGFIRMAIKYGTKLVPVYSFGETEMLDVLSFGESSRVQRWFIKRLRINPHFPIGRWKLPVVHRPKHGITVVVGRPVHVIQSDEPTEQYVKQIHQQYYDNLREVFEAYKQEVGHGDETLVFVDK